MMENKRGQFMQSELGKWILLAISAVILISAIAYFSPLYASTAEKEACRNSVLLRGSLLGQLNVPLSCKTQNITITSTDENKIKSEIAREMYDCWDMLGQGKIDFFGESIWKQTTGFDTVKPACVICSRIKFDKNVQQKISGVDIDSYMALTNVPGKDFTYLEYFSDEKGTKLPTDYKITLLRTDQEYAVVFAGMKGGDLLARMGTDALLLGIGGAAAIKGSIATIGPVATGKFIIKAAKFAAGKGWWNLLLLIPIGVQMGFELWNQHLSAVYCDGSKGGCFIVSIIPYSAEAIKTSCTNIESIS